MVNASIFSVIRKKTRMPILTTIIYQHSFGVIDLAIREDTEIKGIQIGKEVVNSQCLQRT